jgi:NADPH:quinone reductase-like Zn-dependent oxidoreductase
MKAIVRDRYGSAEVLSLGEVPTPTCGDDGFGAFAEYALVPEKAWRPSPPT